MYDNRQESCKGLKIFVYKKGWTPDHPLAAEQITVSFLKTRANSVRTTSLDQKMLEVDSIIQSRDPNALKYISSGFPAQGINTGFNLLWFQCKVAIDLVDSLETTA